MLPAEVKQSMTIGTYVQPLAVRFAAVAVRFAAVAVRFAQNGRLVKAVAVQFVPPVAVRFADYGRLLLSLAVRFAQNGRLLPQNGRLLVHIMFSF